MEATIEKKIAELEEKVNWQEHLHRHVDENGNVKHFYNLVPVIIVAAVIGAVTGAFVSYIILKKG